MVRPTISKLIPSRVSHSGLGVEIHLTVSISNFIYQWNFAKKLKHEKSLESRRDPYRRLGWEPNKKDLKNRGNGIMVKTGIKISKTKRSLAELFH